VPSWCRKSTLKWDLCARDSVHKFKIVVSDGGCQAIAEMICVKQPFLREISKVRVFYKGIEFLVSKSPSFTFGAETSCFARLISDPLLPFIEFKLCTPPGAGVTVVVGC
jgi:hypothetical protein